MKKRWIFTFLLATAFGAAMHFFYDWLPLPLVGLFAPISESVWEHLKLLFWPFLLSGAVLIPKMENRRRALGAFLAAALLQPLLLLAAFYTLRGALGLEMLWTDIGLYVLTMAAGYALAWEFYQEDRPALPLGLLIILGTIYGAALVLFSVAAPNLPIFMAP